MDHIYRGASNGRLAGGSNGDSAPFMFLRNILPDLRTHFLVNKLANMSIQPILLQDSRINLAGAGNKPDAFAGLALALKRLDHAPLRAGVEESQFRPDGQRAVARDAHLEIGHVEH